MIQKMFCLIFQLRILFTSQNTDKPIVVIRKQRNNKFCFLAKMFGKCFFGKKYPNINTLYLLG